MNGYLIEPNRIVNTRKGPEHSGKHRRHTSKLCKGLDYEHNEDDADTCNNNLAAGIKEKLCEGLNYDGVDADKCNGIIEDKKKSMGFATRGDNNTTRISDTMYENKEIYDELLYEDICNIKTSGYELCTEERRPYISKEDMKDPEKLKKHNEDIKKYDDEYIKNARGFYKPGFKPFPASSSLYLEDIYECIKGNKKGCEIIDNTRFKSIIQEDIDSLFFNEEISQQKYNKSLMYFSVPLTLTIEKIKVYVLVNISLLRLITDGHYEKPADYKNEFEELKKDFDDKYKTITFETFYDLTKKLNNNYVNDTKAEESDLTTYRNICKQISIVLNSKMSADFYKDGKINFKYFDNTKIYHTFMFGMIYDTNEKMDLLLAFNHRKQDWLPDDAFKVNSTGKPLYVLYLNASRKRITQEELISDKYTKKISGKTFYMKKTSDYDVTLLLSILGRIKIQN